LGVRDVPDASALPHAAARGDRRGVRGRRGPPADAVAGGAADVAADADHGAGHHGRRGVEPVRLAADRHEHRADADAARRPAAAQGPGGPDELGHDHGGRRARARPHAGDLLRGAALDHRRHHGRGGEGMRSRRSFLALLGVAGAAGIAACGFRSPDAVYAQPPGVVPPQYGGRERVVFWHSYSGRNGKVLDEIVGRFNESQDDVYVEAQYQGSYDDTAQKVAASLIASQVPDIAIFSDVTWERFYINDALEPFDAYFRHVFDPSVAAP